MNILNELKKSQIENAQKLLEEHQFHDAEEIFEQWPDEPESKMGLSVIAYGAGYPEEAAKYLEGLDTLNSWVARATLAKDAEDKAALEEALGKAYELSEGEMWKPLVDFLKEEERWDDMIPILTKAQNELAAMMLADVYVHKSELAMSRNILKKILKQNKNNYAALLELCSIAHKEDDVLPNTISELYRLMRMRATPKATLSAFHNSLGKIFEKKDDIEAAIEHYLEFLKIEFDKIDKNVFKGRLIAEKVAEKYTKELIDNVPEATKECPLIFILGMPRSGTTLIESTLVAHSEIDTYGETVGISLMIDDLMKGKVAPANPDEALEYYMKDKPEKDAKFIIDKMPGNFHYIGAIYQMFPNAKFIYSKRDALDNCVACLTTMFRQGHPYSYDTYEMAMEYLNHIKFMELWNEILPEGTILEVNYEDMVNDHEEQTRRILDYIGLGFEQSCLEFHKVKRDVKTASLAQVVNPIYKTSLSRGQKFLINDEFNRLNEYLQMKYDDLLNINKENLENSDEL